MASKRNENRETTVRFMFWSAEDNDNGKPYEKEERIPYTRSAEIARKTLSEKYIGAMIQVINPLIQDEIVRTVYNPKLVFEYMVADYEYEETANESATEEQTVVPYTMYVYDAQYWAVDDEGNYHTDYVMDNSPLKMTKVDARAFLKMVAEDLSDCTVIGIHNDKREIETRYAIVNNSDLGKCVKQ